MTAVATPPQHEPSRQIDADEYFAHYPLEAITESPLNPRRHYDAQALAELAEQLRTAGQITPGIARPHPSGKTVLVDGVEWLVVELGAGHRRRRALQQAEIPTMALVRRRMDQRAFVELLQVENLQRDNLHPMEEAEGFRTLMEQAGYDIAKIASRVGRDRSYVYDRLKLLQLVPHAQDLFLSGRFDLGHAIILARLAASEQEKVVGDPSIGYVDGGLFTRDRSTMREMGGGLAIQEVLESDLDGLKPVSTRELQSWINEMIRFRPEDVDTPNLFPETAAALAAAEEERRKVVPITYGRTLTGPAKDPAQRTYLRDAWKRADGQPDSGDYGQEGPGATCKYSILGMVVAGLARGTSFEVCVAKKKCAIHWAKELVAAANQAKGRDTSRATAGQGASSLKEIAPPDELVRSWLAEEFAAAADRLLPKAMATLKDLLILPDDIAWNLSRAIGADGIGDWAAVGKRANRWFNGVYREDLEQILMPKLPGKWDPKDSWNPQRDAAAARSSLALAITLSRDYGEKGSKALEALLQARRRKWDTEQSKGAAKSNGGQKKAAPKGTAKKKHAGDVARVKAAKKAKKGAAT